MEGYSLDCAWSLARSDREEKPERETATAVHTVVKGTKEAYGALFGIATSIAHHV